MNTAFSAYERGGVHHRPPLGALTFLPPRPAAAAAPAPARACAERLPPPGRPPVPHKSERSRGKPKAKVYSHYACPATAQLPDFNQAVPHMCEWGRGPRGNGRGAGTECDGRGDGDRVGMGVGTEWDGRGDREGWERCGDRVGMGEGAGMSCD